MTYPLITDALLVGLAVTLVVAAVIDVKTYTISNWLNLGVALVAPIVWWSMDLTWWPDIGLRLIVAALIFLVLLGAFYAGMMGGGDVKLATALALWFSPPSTLRFLVIMSIAGGALTLAMLANHKRLKRQGRPEIPYGVAIAIGGLWIIAQRFLNHFA